jgi:hypothetical protein
MNKTVSTRQIAELGSQCDACRLWYAYLFPSAGDRRLLCPMCATLESANRRKP